MHETLFILTLLGCNDTVTECRAMQSEQVYYASVEECYARSESLIVAHANAPYPVFLAHCDTADGLGSQVASRPQFTPHETLASAQRPARKGVWYRIPAARTVADAASTVVDGAEHIASAVGQRMENMFRRTSETVRRLNPFEPR